MTAPEEVPADDNQTTALVLIGLLGAVVGFVVALVVALVFLVPDQAPITVVPGQDSLTDTINSAPDGALVVLAPGDHGTKDLADLAGRGVTVRCDDGAIVRRFKLQRVTDLRLEGCVMTPAASDVGVYVQDGSNISVSGFSITGGERGVLVQAANKAERDGWTVGVDITHNAITNTIDDATAIYGGVDVTIADNVISLHPDGCNVEHSDGVQVNGAVNLRVLHNTITSTAAGPPNMTCPAGDYPHDQGLIVTARSGYPEDVAEHVTFDGNTISDWWSGLAALVDGKGTKDIQLLNTTFVCSSRTSWKLTGDTSQVTEQGTTSVPCGRAEDQDRDP